MMQTRGYFITFEGPECAGKTTHIGMLQEFFAGHGRECVITREPGGTEIGEELRQIVKHHQGDHPVADEAEVLLFSASRAQHVRELILPAVQAGKIVLCDRFADSTTAYQGHARGLDMDFIRQLNLFATCGCIPNLTILMDLSAEESIARSLKREGSRRNEDRIESETSDFHRLVRQGFLTIAELEPARVKVVSAVPPKAEVHAHIVELVQDAFGKF